MFFKSTIATLFLLISASISHSEMFVCKTPEPFPMVGFKIYYDETDWHKNSTKHLTVVDSNGKVERYDNSVQVIVGSIELEPPYGKSAPSPLMVTQLRNIDTTTRAYFFDDDGNIASIKINWWSGSPPSKENRPVEFEFHERYLTFNISDKVITGNCN